MFFLEEQDFCKTFLPVLKLGSSQENLEVMFTVGNTTSVMKNVTRDQGVAIWKQDSVGSEAALATLSAHTLPRLRP